MIDLNGKTAFVTGASRGLGRAIALRLGEADNEKRPKGMGTSMKCSSNHICAHARPFSAFRTICTVARLQLEVLRSIWIVALCVIFSTSISAASAQKISRFGEYGGYSERKYNSYVRKSQYVAVRDGTRLAVDIYFPAMDRRQEKDKLPVIVRMTPYWRASQTPEGKLVTFVDPDAPENLRFLLEHGYIIVVASMRGTGASFGQDPGHMSLVQNRDSFDLIEWVGRQSWSSGKVGMSGISYAGVSQLGAASQSPPSLKAIFPAVVPYDLNESLVHGGVYMKASSVSWGTGADKRNGFDGKPTSRAGNYLVPVDGDEGEVLLEAAIADHLKDGSENFPRASDVKAMLAGMEYRWRRGYPLKPYLGGAGPSEYIEDINGSGIPIYLFGGWRDWFAGSPLHFMKNLSVPRKIVIGPWAHGDVDADASFGKAFIDLYRIEALRWYDYWLKGKENGVMDGPLLNYAVMTGDDAVWSWKSTDEWPVSNVLRKDYYLADGRLSSHKPKRRSKATFIVDYTATTGAHTRYYNAQGGGPLDYPEMSNLNGKGLVYTSNVLEEDLTVLGYPVVSLSVASSASDGEIYAYLEKVTPDGKSHFVTEGVLKASRRVLGTPPYEFMGLPWYDGRKEVVDTTPPWNKSGVIELEFYLQPTGMMFEKGTRLRVAITGADADHSFAEPVSPAPNVTVYSGGKYITKISLPILDPSADSRPSAR